MNFEGESQYFFPFHLHSFHEWNSKLNVVTHFCLVITNCESFCFNERVYLISFIISFCFLCGLIFVANAIQLVIIEYPEISFFNQWKTNYFYHELWNSNECFVYIFLVLIIEDHFPCLETPFSCSTAWQQRFICLNIAYANWIYEWNEWKYIITLVGVLQFTLHQSS